jgi:hypothetical protein
MTICAEMADGVFVVVVVVATSCSYTCSGALSSCSPYGANSSSYRFRYGARFGSSSV